MLKTSLYRFLSLRSMTTMVNKGFCKQALIDHIRIAHREKELTIHDWKDMKSKFDIPFSAFAITSLSQVVDDIKSSRSLYSYLESENALSLYVRCCYITNIAKYKDCTPEDVKYIESTVLEAFEKLPVRDPALASSLMRGIVLTPSWKELGIKLLDLVKSWGLPQQDTHCHLAIGAFRNKDINFAFQLLREISTMKVGFVYSKVLHCGLEYICELNDCKSQETLILQLLPYFSNHSNRAHVYVARHLARAVEEKLENWAARFTKIDESGKCECCHRHLSIQTLTEDEFSTLKTQVLKKVIVRSDVFVRSGPTELQRFQSFMKKVGRYTIVIDGLNLYYGANGYRKFQKLLCLLEEQGEIVLILGRKHLMRKPDMRYVLKRRKFFLTENESCDDPFLLYAALNGGQGTYFISNDFMGGHLVLVGTSRTLEYLFHKWLVQSQVYVNHQLGHVVFPVYNYDYQISKDGCAIHVPYLTGGRERFSQNSDSATWLCIQNIGKERKEALHPLEMPDSKYLAIPSRYAKSQFMRKKGFSDKYELINYRRKRVKQR